MLAPWKESYDQPRQHIKKKIHYFAKKGPSSQSSVFFPVVMYGCKSWTVNKAENWRIDALELWCWRRFFIVPWTARRSNQFILKEVSPEYSLEGLMLNLKLQYFGHLSQRTDSLEKTLMLGKIEGRRRRRWQWVRWLDATPTQWTWVWVSFRNWWWTGKPGVLQSMKLQSWTWPSNWTKLKEELKRLSMKVKEESEKVVLKLNIQKTKILASSPITSWQIDGETMETVTLCFLGLQNHCR